MRQVFLPAVVCLTLVTSTLVGFEARARTLVEETFETYSAGSDLCGQGGWACNFTPPANIVPVVVRAGTFLTTQVIGGPHATALSSQARLFRAFSTKPSIVGQTVLTADMYHYSGNPKSCNTEVSLTREADFPERIGWASSCNPVCAGFEFYGSGFWSPVTECITGPFLDELIRVEIILDADLGEAYGRLHHSGGVEETAHHPISLCQIEGLDSVSVYLDYRGDENATQTPSEIDNILVTTAQPDLGQSFREDFERYTPASDLCGQRGWECEFTPTESVVPVVVRPATHLATQVIGGPHGTSLSSEASLFNPRVRPSSVGKTILTADMYHYSGNPRSCNTEVGLATRDSFPDERIGWASSCNPVCPGFEFFGPGFWASGVECVTGPFLDEPLEVEIVLDADAGEIYGRLRHSGGVEETAHHAVASCQMAELDRVHVYLDYRGDASATQTPSEIDNITVSTPSSSLPGLTTAAAMVLAVSLTGLGLRVVRRRRAG